jgi:hypothetical protein
VIEALKAPKLEHASAYDNEAGYLRSLSRMRRFIGCLGVALPFLLIGIAFGLHEHPWWRGSLSAYYYTGGREVFVAALSATGIFLISYRVGEVGRANTFTTIAGVCAVLIALFPTVRPSDKKIGPDKIPLTELQKHLTEKGVGGFHYFVSFVFILLLAVMARYFARQEEHDLLGLHRRSAAFLRRWHLTCFWLIIGAAAWVGGLWAAQEFGLIREPPHRYIFWGEIVSAFAFGASWLMMGVEIEKKQKLATKAQRLVRQLKGESSPREPAPAVSPPGAPPPGGTA